MLNCSEFCPVHHVMRCCYSCEERETCKSVCAYDSPDVCENAVDEPEPEYLPAMIEKQAEPVMKELRELVVQRKALEEKEKALKDRLKTLMEETDSKSFKNNPFLNITYVAASELTGIDSALVKKKYPAVFAECSKVTKKSSYIKVEVRE